MDPCKVFSQKALWKLLGVLLGGRKNFELPSARSAASLSAPALRLSVNTRRFPAGSKANPLLPVPSIQVICAQNRLILFGFYPQRNREEQLKAEVFSLKESLSSEWKHERLLDGVLELIDASPGRLKLHRSGLVGARR